MPGPLEGITVVELGLWVAGPSAGAVLADWGAAVVKIEPHDGDPFRGMYLTVAGAELPVNPPFELDNRGKRSIALDLGTAEGKRVAHELLSAQRRARCTHPARSLAGRAAGGRRHRHPGAPDAGLARQGRSA